MELDDNNIDQTGLTQDKKETHVQEPWTEWRDGVLAKTISWFSEDENGYPRPNDSMPEYLKVISFDLPHNESEVESIRQLNNTFLEARKGKPEGVFYRPGLGYGEALPEILEKIGCFNKMVITDPVYSGKDIKGPYGVEALLPVDYFHRTLRALDAQNITIKVFNPDNTEIKLSSEQQEDIEIPNHGKATLEFALNGTPMTIELLTEDMTTLGIGKVDILGLGRPTPTNENVSDPRFDPDFFTRQISKLNLDGVVHYSSSNFSFLPSSLPPEAFGLRKIVDYSSQTLNPDIPRELKDTVIIQKYHEQGEKLASIERAKNLVYQAVGALAGNIPLGEDMSNSVYMSQYVDETEHIPGNYVDTLYDIYRKNISELHRFVDSMADQEAKTKTISRIEFLLMGPITVDGEFSKDKITRIQSVSTDPDKQKKIEGKRNVTYFGDLSPLIKDHNAGKLNLFDYYRHLYDIFYKEFTELKK